MSLNPRAIIFVPDEITEIEIDPNTEVICPNAFRGTKIKSIRLPKTLKKIFIGAFFDSGLSSISIEEGLDFEYIGRSAFIFCFYDEICLRINGKLYKISTINVHDETIELPPDFDSEQMRIANFDFTSVNEITCSRSSLLTLARQKIYNQCVINIIE